MKIKIAILVLFTLLVSPALKAQLGVNAGCNFARFGGINTGNMYEVSLAGFSGGLFYDKQIVHYLDLRAGVMYSPKGSCLKYENSYSSIYEKTFVKYIEIPVQIKANAGPFSALGGIYGAYALKSYSTYQAKGLSGGFIVTDDFTNLRRIDFGLKVGAGYQYKVGPVKIFTQGDYSLGLLNINNTDAEQNDKLRNKVFSLSVGALINIF